MFQDWCQNIDKSWYPPITRIWSATFYISLKKIAKKF